MQRTLLHRALALVLGVSTGAVLWWFDAAPGLAAAAGLSVLVLWLAMSRAVREHPVYTSTDGSWRDNRWSAIGQVFVIMIAFQAVFSVDVPLIDQVGLHVVVLSTFMIGYFFGGLDALERESSESPQSSSGAEPADD
ncbi:hypothetical protein [Halosimplex salinum]|uniref:hypothetical protein n=1 Tax=Halosimplex salinum TaxID=1710538 RepID=UPI000F471786|nr:hypothetical protein [Halosimplex salinum]